MQLESTLTCPHCGHQATEAMPTDACQFFYDCRGCFGLSQSPVIAACSAPTAPCRALRFKGVASKGVAARNRPTENIVPAFFGRMLVICERAI